MESSERKRKPESGEGSPERPVKVRRTIKTRNLLELSDDVLLTILDFLNSSDLLSLTEVCTRLYRVATDESLWRKVDTFSFPLPPSRFRKLLKYVGPKTHVIHIGGRVTSKSDTVTPSILAALSEKCPRLVELILDHCYIDAER
jgi:hypothetical protein